MLNILEFINNKNNNAVYNFYNHSVFFNYKNSIHINNQIQSDEYILSITGNTLFETPLLLSNHIRNISDNSLKYKPKIHKHNPLNILNTNTINWDGTNLAINKTSPQYNLDINGTLKCNSINNIASLLGVTASNSLRMLFIDKPDSFTNNTYDYSVPGNLGNGPAYMIVSEFGGSDIVVTGIYKTNDISNESNEWTKIIYPGVNISQVYTKKIIMNTTLTAHLVRIVIFY